jgi:heme A synthase
MVAPTPGFRRLTLATLVATVALVVLGGVVRVSDSGLGCGPAGSGVNGWPLCRGDLVPGLDPGAVIEYAHRALASLVGLLVLAVAALAWRRLRAHRRVVRAALAAAALVIAQGLLGAATVERNLDPLLVAAHLGLAMLLLALLLYVLHASRAEVIGAPPPDAGAGVRVLAVAAPALVFLTIVAGGYMAGTEKHGRTDYQPASGAHYACGHEFPTCNGEFFPLGQTQLADVHLTHRLFMYLASVALLALVVAVARRRPSSGVARSAWVALGLLALQILLGAANVWLTTEYDALIVAHLTVATLLWTRLVWLALALQEVPYPAGVARPVPAPGEAVTA